VSSRTSSKRMKIAVVFLLLSNLATGILSIYLLGEVDGRYSELIGRSVPALSDVRRLMAGTVTAMRTTHPSNFQGASARDWAKALDHVRKALATERNLRADVVRKHGPGFAAQDIDAIVKSGEEFDGTVDEAIRLYSSAGVAEVERVRDEQLLPAFDRHVAALGRTADAIEAQSLTANSDYTIATRRLAPVVLGVAGWPLIAVTAAFLLMAIIVSVLWFKLDRGDIDSRS